MKKYSALALLVTLGSANAFAQNNEPAAPAAEPTAPAAEETAPAAEPGAEAAPAADAAAAETPAAEEAPAEPAPIDCAKAKEECKLIDAPTAEELAAKKKADEDAKAAEAAAADALPPMPWVALGDTEFDWVQIDSDEWLKGKVKKMRDGDFEFDSDQFGVLTFGWGDVKILHTTTRYTFVDENKQVYTGTVEKSTDGQVKIKTDEGLKTVDAGVVLSIVKETATEWAKWGLAASLGGTARAGNTESIDYTGMLRVSRRDEFTRWVNQYDGSYGEVSGDPNTNKHLGVTRFDIFIAKRFYVTPFYGEARYDKFQNISLRWAAAAGGGVHVIQDGPFTLDFDATAGYQQTNFINVVGAEKLDGALVAPGVTLEWDITPDIDFDAAWKSTIIVTDLDKPTNQTYHHGSARFSVALTNILDFQLSGIFDRIENPQQLPADPANPPATIVQNDLAVTVGLGLDLE